MKLRRISTRSGTALAARHEPTDTWIDLEEAQHTLGGESVGSDLVLLLAARERGRDRVSSLMDAAVAEGVATVRDCTPLLPYAPSSLRCFLGWEAHWIRAAHQMVRTNLPAAAPFVRGYETLTRRTFPALKPKASFYDHPAYYTGNHLTIVADGAPMPWPSYTQALDFELEFAMIVDRPLKDASSTEAADAIGGFVVFDDFSARDVQWEEERKGSFGPVVKTKTFGSSLGSVIVTPDEVLDRIDRLDASVVVDGQTWSSTSTRGLHWSPGETVAYASRGEQVYPGELITSGTLPMGCGLELDRWIEPGNEVVLTIDGIGSVSNVVAAQG
ncbi:fumarylacetoacetase [Rhodococcoides trifolii]|uniref:Fumarylacetoacetase n=1 Tax=Rhodococcoides trifolii TaxID=908250 RepID=A0A917G193_9NOCA|nr:fumarylacetoacetate hydrolase family protein [Rhodococcus trifolii]GGG17375.1 fumarylacetoacetase [Rhodococcus trifolii]